jgi:hypothetical protein
MKNSKNITRLTALASAAVAVASTVGGMGWSDGRLKDNVTPLSGR